MLSTLGNRLQEKGVYNTWMLQEQDQIQALAKAYADRIVAESCMDVLATEATSNKMETATGTDMATGASTDLTPMLKKVFHLHLLARIEADLAWFISNDLLSAKQAEQVNI